MKKTFLSIYNATAEAVKGAKAELVKKKNLRAVESAIDSAEGEKIKAEEDLDIALNVVSTGGTIDVNEVLRLRQKHSDAEATIQALTEFKEEFFAEDVKA